MQLFREEFRHVANLQPGLHDRRLGQDVNATGAHCHFEIRNENVSVDPRGYLSESPSEDVIFANNGAVLTSPTRKQAPLPRPDLIP